MSRPLLPGDGIVYDGWAAFYDGAWFGRNFTLSSSYWQGGEADCTARLVTWSRNGREQPLATTGFRVDAYPPKSVPHKRGPGSRRGLSAFRAFLSLRSWRMQRPGVRRVRLGDERALDTDARATRMRLSSWRVGDSPEVRAVLGRVDRERLVVRIDAVTPLAPPAGTTPVFVSL